MANDTHEGARGLENLAAKVQTYQNVERGNDPRHWDKMARPFKSYERMTQYARRFLQLADIHPGQTVLDCGCGSGTLAIPLSDQGFHVTGVDFSTKMLQSVRDVIEQEGIETIGLIQAAWEDDWTAAGVPICDVAVASRSVFGDNLQRAVHQLDAFARSRCCLTVPASSTMFHQTQLERFLGREVQSDNGSLKTVLDAVFELGRQPEVHYIRSLRLDVYDEPHMVCQHLESRLGRVEPGERPKFDQYCLQHVVQHVGQDGQPDGWYCDQDLESAWAFVSWDKQPFQGDIPVAVRHH